jgi:steroid 5-alpha reductase family enzyme
VKKYIGSIPFFILNITFISFIQSVLLFLLAAPTYALLLASQHEKEISAVDIMFTATQLGLVLTEWFSDQQQWGLSRLHLWASIFG